MSVNGVLRWYGLTERMDEKRLMKRIFESECGGRREIYIKKRWMDNMRDYLKGVWEATRRNCEWQECVEGFCEGAWSGFCVRRWTLNNAMPQCMWHPIIWHCWCWISYEGLMRLLKVWEGGFLFYCSYLWHLVYVKFTFCGILVVVMLIMIKKSTLR